MHVKTNHDVVDNYLHFSHLFHYVSAYALSDEMVKQLWDDLQQGLAVAKRDTKFVRVDQDGEFFFICNPSGSFDLCIRWKSYTVAEEKE